MTDCSAVAAVAATTSAITYMDVIRKFKEMKINYYSERGCMISTLNDKFSKQFLEKHPDLKWREKYNKHAEATVLTAKININIFGKLFKIFLHRPIKQIHRWEYEYFFGFGGHNAGFSLDRIIMTFVETFDKSIDFEYMLMTGTLASADGCNMDDTNINKCCTIDENYVKNVLKLLVVGGYVKQWNAFNHFTKWFKENGFDYEINISDCKTMSSFFFEGYEVSENGEGQ